MKENVYRENPQIWYQEEGKGGYVRIFHAVPDAPNVDIYADGDLIAGDLPYGQFTEYLSLPEGNYEITVYPAGMKNTPVLRNMLPLKQGSAQTVAAVGTLDTIGLLAIPDAMIPRHRYKSMVRFCHLSPNAPEVDITLPDGTVLFHNVAFKQLTPYIAVPPQNYTLQVRLAGTETVVLTVPGVNLEPSEFNTVYAIGLAGETPELEALLVSDGAI